MTAVNQRRLVPKEWAGEPWRAYAEGMRVLVTGISGYVGPLLAQRLTAAGHEVRGLARRPERVEGPWPVAAVDLSDGAGLPEALAGVDAAYYLVHSMEGTVDFAATEQAAARRFAAAAAEAGVRRIIYMSVLVPERKAPSAHVRSRVAVEQILAATGVPTISLRASIVIGAQSRSFGFLLRLVERAPLLPMPPWRTHRTAPIDERDLIDQLTRALDVPLAQPLSVVDAVGPQVITYQELIEAILDVLMLSRPTVPLPVAWTALAAPVAAAIAGEDLGLVSPLMQSLTSDLVAREATAQDVDLGRARRGVTAAIEHALRDREQASQDEEERREGRR